MIYIKTELGKTEFQDKSLGFSLRQRSAFILFNGNRTVADIIQMTSALSVTTSDIDHMVAAGVLAPSVVSSGKPTVSALPISPPVSSVSSVSSVKPTVVASTLSPPVSAEKAKLDEQVQYAKAYPIAVKLTSALGFRGFMLNLSVESASDLKALRDLAPKIKKAAGVEKFKELEDALYLL